MKSNTLTFECVNVLLYHLEQLGINKQHFISSAGLDPKCLHISDHRIAPEAFTRIIKEAINITGDPFLGLHVGIKANLDALGLVGQLYRYSTDAISGSQKITQYLPILHTSFYYGSRIEAQTFSIYYQPLHHGANCKVGVRQLIDLTLAFNKRGIQYGYQQEVRPLAAKIGFPLSKREIKIYEDVLQCPVIASAPLSALVFHLKDVQQLHPFSNPPLLEGLEKYAQAELALIRKEGPYCLSVRKYIVRSLSAGEKPNFNEIANNMGISPNVLRERMKKESGNFSQILNDVRIHIAGNTMKEEQEYGLVDKAVTIARELERSRIARDLHDGISGMLSAAKMHLSIFQQNTNAVSELNKAIGLLDNATTEVRKTAHNLLPEMLHQYGLSEALMRYCQSLSSPQSIRVEFHVMGIVPSYQQNFELAIYRIVQELVHNAIKHARAKRILVQLTAQKSVLSLTIEDDGSGINEKDAMGFGLLNMHQRVKMLNGKLNIQSVANEGTSIYAEFDTKAFLQV